MTAKQLEALLIDQALGELSEEASALLDHHLAHHPDARAEAGTVRDAVSLAGAAVASRPLALEPDGAIPFPTPTPRFPVFLRLAASVALLGLAAGAGFFTGKAGRDSAPSRPAVAEGKRSAAPSPWAQYRVEENGRLAVILPSDPNS